MSALEQPSERQIHCANLHVTPEFGLHLRPAAALVKQARCFEAEIEISLDGRKANAKSILSVAQLGAECGTSVVVTAAGRDAHDAIQAITGLFASHFNQAPLPAIPGSDEPNGKRAAMPESPRSGGGRVPISAAASGLPSRPPP